MTKKIQIFPTRKEKRTKAHILEHIGDSGQRLSLFLAFYSVSIHLQVQGLLLVLHAPSKCVLPEV
jgi:hypothetical protein